MRLAPITAGLLTAAVMVLSGPAAHAQSQTNQNGQTKDKTDANIVVVNDGDTLDGIATEHQTTYMRLFDANTNIQDPDVIYPGDKVRVPDPSEQLAERALPATAPVAPAATAPVSSSAPAVAAYVAPAPVPQAAPVAGCGDNSYANYIYSHESGCRTTAMSPNGCYGIGQACPASKIAYCGADYACQNAFFTAYAGKYGGWAGAYNFWVSHGWW
jgi:LysM repeat protein